MRGENKFCVLPNLARLTELKSLQIDGRALSAKVV